MTDLPPPPGNLPPPPPPGSPLPPPPGFATPPPGYQVYAAPTEPNDYASFGARLGGWLLDYLIMGLFFLPAFIAIAAGPTEIRRCSVDASGNVTIGEEINALCEGPTDGTIAFAVVLGLIAVVAVFVYQIKLIGGPRGATVGMRAVGIKVVDRATGGSIGGGRALGRFLFASIFSGFFYLGYLWMLWDGRSQTWQDKVVNDVVVKA